MDQTPVKACSGTSFRRTSFIAGIFHLLVSAGMWWLVAVLLGANVPAVLLLLLIGVACGFAVFAFQSFRNALSRPLDRSSPVAVVHWFHNRLLENLGGDLPWPTLFEVVRCQENASKETQRENLRQFWEAFYRRTDELLEVRIMKEKGHLDMECGNCSGHGLPRPLYLEGSRLQDWTQTNSRLSPDHEHFVKCLHCRRDICVSCALSRGPASECPACGCSFPANTAVRHPGKFGKLNFSLVFTVPTPKLSGDGGEVEQYIVGTCEMASSGSAAQYWKLTTRVDFSDGRWYLVADPPTFTEIAQSSVEAAIDESRK